MDHVVGSDGKITGDGCKQLIPVGGGSKIMGDGNGYEESALEQWMKEDGICSCFETPSPFLQKRMRTWMLRHRQKSSYSKAKSMAMKRRSQKIATKIKDGLSKLDSGGLSKCDSPEDLMQCMEDMHLGKDQDYVVVELEWDPDIDCELDPELERYLARLEPEKTPDWNIKRVSWEEHVVNVLHMVRLHQITEYDPVHRCPVMTRFCKYNLAYFDFEKESRAMHGLPLRNLTSYQHKLLEESVNVVSMKILKSDVGYPISVFGTVLARDQVDYKCVYLFRRDKDDPQVINSPEDMLHLTDPCRGFSLTSSMFFEINLKIRGDSGDPTVFSKGVVEHNTCLGDSRPIMKKVLTSWHSTVQLAYTPVPFAVQANLTVSILHEACDFTGEVIAWTSQNLNKIILHDSKVAGTSTELGADGSVVLSRRLVAVPVDENLVVRICIRDGAREAACFEFTLCHSDDDRTLYDKEYIVKVKVEWTAILSTMWRTVLHDVGMTRVLI
ncbi:hypothetical protein EJB05_36404 [Eragrostis curvula]|uniref:DUF6598 domain-containing protein n=1 Tax=Eragrostis curvula TaxID=38414 RepID=A0A5J9U996_9POAL|nr:hypothetical protein EJB05_36404 [Eragrostis curvula]